MGSAGNGAKAGVVAGIAYGILLGIVSYFTLISIKSTVISVLSQNLPPNSPFTPEQLFGIALLLTPVIVVVVGVIGGLILGAIYGKLIEKIPGKTPVIKGIVLGVVLWLLVSVLGGYNNIHYGLEYYLVQVGTGLVGALLFGVLLGYFYGRFMRPKETYTMI
ncbi:MAG: hypothetical protein OK474_00200 [Thaumarchaeota archaeon]|nr:hypothetical protein [Nitrososphaerota archaeon]